MNNYEAIIIGAIPFIFLVGQIILTHLYFRPIFFKGEITKSHHLLVERMNLHTKECKEGLTKEEKIRAKYLDRRSIPIYAANIIVQGQKMHINNILRILDHEDMEVQKYYLRQYYRTVIQNELDYPNEVIK